MSELTDAPALSRLTPAWTAVIDDYPVALSWSPDGRRVAVAGGEGLVGAFNHAGECESVLTAHTPGTLALSWTADSATLVTSGQDGCARLWDSAGHCTATLPGDTQWVENVRCAPTGDLIATVSGRQLVFWRHDGTRAMTCEPEEHTILDCSWTADGHRLVTSAYGGIRFWQPDRSRPVASHSWQGAPIKLAVNRDATRLAAGLQEGGVLYWRFDEPEELFMRGYPGKVRCLSWDAGGRYLATGGGASIAIWSCTDGGPAETEPAVMDLHTKPASALAFAPRGAAIASGSRDGSAVVVNPTRDPAAAAVTRESPVTALAWQPTAEHVAFAFADGRIVTCPGAPQR